MMCSGGVYPHVVTHSARVPLVADRVREALIATTPPCIKALATSLPMQDISVGVNSQVVAYGSNSILEADRGQESLFATPFRKETRATPLPDWSILAFRSVVFVFLTPPNRMAEPLHRLFRTEVPLCGPNTRE